MRPISSQVVFFPKVERKESQPTRIEKDLVCERCEIIEIKHASRSNTNNFLNVHL
jgi:hypothetical protein